MAKLNPGKIKRPEAERRVFTLNLGEDSDTFTVKKLGSTAIMAAADDASALTLQYVTGYGEKDTKGYIPPIALPPVGDEVAYASARAFNVACVLNYAQVVEDEEDRYSPVDIVLLMADDDILDVLTDAYHWCLAESKPKDDLGNSSETQDSPQTATV